MDLLIRRIQCSWSGPTSVLWALASSLQIGVEMVCYSPHPTFKKGLCSCFCSGDQECFSVSLTPGSKRKKKSHFLSSCHCYLYRMGEWDAALLHPRVALNTSVLWHAVLQQYNIMDCVTWVCGAFWSKGETVKFTVLHSLKSQGNFCSILFRWLKFISLQPRCPSG